MSKYKPVINSYLRCIENSNFIYRFYEIFLSKDENIKSMFAHVDFDKQTKLLRHGLLSMITYLDQESSAGKFTFDRLRETHGTGGMDIKPEQYSIWKESMLQTIEEIDTEFNAEIKSNWIEVLDTCIRMIQKEA